VKRRDFIALLGGATSWPVAARAQQPERMRRIAVIMALAETDSQTQDRIAALKRSLQALGWFDGQNVKVELRSGSGAHNIRDNISALLDLKPDVLLSAGTASLAQLVQTTRTIPIVFVNVADPVGAGYVESLARPGRNVTGILQAEYSLSGKWPELLKQFAPHLTRVAVIRDPTLTSGIGQFAVVQSVAPSLSLDVQPVDAREASEIERGIVAFARSGTGGLIVTAGASSNVNRNRIIALADQHKLPAVYAQRVFVTSGGLMSYSANNLDQFRQAATYIDRILKGEKPSDLPVQTPTKYELVINLKSAKALGITMPPTLLARADEVIE
jgi:putative tryptophan/tyrosine transport system substrate-binding protein